MNSYADRKFKCNFKKILIPLCQLGRWRDLNYDVCWLPQFLTERHWGPGALRPELAQLSPARSASQVRKIEIFSISCKRSLALTSPPSFHWTFEGLHCKRDIFGRLTSTPKTIDCRRCTIDDSALDWPGCLTDISLYSGQFSYQIDWSFKNSRVMKKLLDFFSGICHCSIFCKANIWSHWLFLTTIF